MNKDTGGPAFPIDVSSISHMSGMTLRDYFAAKALPAALDFVKQEAEHFGDAAPHQYVIPETVVRVAYRYADAMLAERSK